MKLLSIIILQSWAATLSADNCVYPKYAITEVKSVEIYQMTHIMNTTISEAAVKIDLIKNFTLQPGTVCLYDDGTCYDLQNRLRYNRDLPEGNLTCHNITRLHTNGNYTYHILTLKWAPFVRFLVAESATSLFSVQLVKEQTVCNKTVWSTDQSQLVVAVEEENFINTTYEFEDFFLDKPVSSRKEDIYTAMMIKCDLYSHVMAHEEHTNGTRSGEVDSEFGRILDVISSYEEEILQLKENLSSFQKDVSLRNYEFENLRGEINEIKVAMRDMQKEIARYKGENAHLKKSLKGVKNQLVKSESAKLVRDFSETEDEVEVFGKDNNTLRKENMLDLPQFFIKALNDPENCPSFMFFPYDYLLCVLVSILYMIFAVINTIMNYFSLRLLRNTRQKCFVFYALTQGLTTRYICRNQRLTKNKVDKWLLDIE